MMLIAHFHDDVLWLPDAIVVVQCSVEFALNKLAVVVVVVAAAAACTVCSADHRLPLLATEHTSADS